MSQYVCITVVLIATLLAVASIITAYYIYKGVFVYKTGDREEADYIPDSVFYAGVRAELAECMDDMKNEPSEAVTVMSYDGLKLYGRFYRGQEDAPVVIFFHGYHGTYMRDGYGMFRLCRDRGYGILMVDERAHGKSAGDTVTFGINEMQDCLSWIKLADNIYHTDAGIIIAGVSMGASAVLMAAGSKDGTAIPESVRAVVSDCAFTSVRDIIRSMCVKMHYPVNISYTLARLGAKLFGHIDIGSSDTASALRAVESIRIPVMFIHGSSDSVVPASMCDRLYNACSSYKRRVIINGSEHAVNALTDYAVYEAAVGKFIDEVYG